MLDTQQVCYAIVTRLTLGGVYAVSELHEFRSMDALAIFVNAYREFARKHKIDMDARLVQPNELVAVFEPTAASNGSKHMELRVRQVNALTPQRSGRLFAYCTHL